MQYINDWRGRFAAALCFTLFLNAASADPYASRVVDYQPGTGFAVEFGSGLGYTNTITVLGAPSQVTPGTFGGPVDPFAPPYLASQLLSIGEGGHVTLEFDTPIFNHPHNPYGLDFILFGNAGFNIVNGDFSGGGITDGSLFGSDEAQASVWVSADNETFYQLDPEQTPKVDGYFPLDGQGDFGLPVDPSLRPTDFDQAGYDRIRALYQGSGGGAGFDLSWALDAADLTMARFVRIEVQSGKVELDAVSSVSPSYQASSWVLEEDFSASPEMRGWESFGTGAMFEWESEAQRLAVTWDSLEPNSLFYHRLPGVLTADDDFSLAFDLHLEHIALGRHPEKPFTFPIVVGLLSLEEATREQYFRGSGIHADHGPRSVVDWNYLPDSGFGATVSSGLISKDNQWAFQNTFPLEMPTGSLYQIEMHFNASEGVLKTSMTRDGAPFGPIQEATLSNIFGNPLDGGFSGLDVDAFSISSFSDEGQNPPEFAGSILAGGWIDNIRVEHYRSMPSFHVSVEDGRIALQFEGKAGRTYWLERSVDFERWSTVDVLEVDTDHMVSFSDPLGLDQAFYRLQETGL